MSFDAARSPVSFQFSGGTWGAALGMGQYAVEELDARKIAMIYAEFGPITDAAELGKRAMEAAGAEVTLVSVAPVNADMVQALNTAAQSDPDVIIALTADSGCKPTMQTAQQLGLDVPIMYTGACAAPKILDSVGDAAEGAIFNLEAELGRQPRQRRVPGRYPTGTARSTTTKRKAPARWPSVATINLYAQLRELGAEAITPDAILAAFRGAVDAPSFFGHPYTCDGEQLDGYPAFCAPQQSLGTVKSGEIEALTGWIDVREFAA